MNTPNRTTQILTGTLVGATAGFIDFAIAFGSVDSYPLASQINFFLLSWATGAALGFMVALALVLSALLTPKWLAPYIPSAATKVLAAYTFLALLPPDLAPVGLALAASAACVVAFTFQFAAKFLPLLEDGHTWACLSAATSIVATIMISTTVPVVHDIAYASLFAASAPVVLTAIAVAVMAQRSVTMPTAAIVALLIALVAIPFGTRIDKPAPLTDRPNIVLVSIDTLRADHIGAYGNTTVKTPYIDALAQQGISFDQTISPFPLTNPSHTSMLTGLYPGNHGVDQNRPLPFKAGVESLPAQLAKEGYSTAGFVSGYTLERQLSQIHREFQTYDDALGNLGPATNRWRDNRIARIGFKIAERLNFLKLFDLERPGGPTVDAALAWMHDNADAPFFLFVHMYDPHGDYAPPPPYDTMYTDYTGPATGDWYGLSELERSALINDEAALEHIRNLYKGEVTYADAQFGRITTALADLGLDDNTLVILTSDHGESLGAHNYYFDHGRCLYDDLVRVPLIMRFPKGDAAGARVADQVRLFDIVPTIHSFLDMNPSAPTDGGTLMGYIDGETPLPEATPIYSMAGDTHTTERLMSIRTAQHKLIRNDARWLGSRLRPGSDEFYRLSEDLEETNNLIDQAPEELPVFKDALDAHWERWYKGTPRSQTPVDTSTQEALESLGYL